MYLVIIRGLVEPNFRVRFILPLGFGIKQRLIARYNGASLGYMS